LQDERDVIFRMQGRKLRYSGSWRTVKGFSTVSVRLITRSTCDTLFFSRDGCLFFGFTFWVKERTRYSPGVRTEVVVAVSTTVPPFLATASGVARRRLCAHVPDLFRQDLRIFMRAHPNVLVLLAVARNRSLGEKNRYVVQLQFVVDGNSPGFLWGREIVELAEDLHDSHIWEEMTERPSPE
jgi:hypothetical protein